MSLFLETAYLICECLIIQLLASLYSPYSVVFLTLYFILILMWQIGKCLDSLGKTDSWIRLLELCHLGKVSFSETRFLHL